MPFSIQISDNPNNPVWKKPDNLFVYDSGWQTVKVGWVYNLGVWKVVYPDPINPSVQSIFAGAYGDKYSVKWELRVINCDYLIAYLYSGSTQSTLLQTQTIQTNENIIEDLRITFDNLSNNTTYNMKVIGYSITENQSTALFSGPVTTTNVIIPTVNITSMIPNSNLSSVQINWTSTNQYNYDMSIWSLPENERRFQLMSGNSTDRSYTATFNHLPSKQYRVDLRVYSTSFDDTLDSDFYTTPNTPSPTYSNFIVGTRTCNSIQVNWNASNYTSGTIELWNVGPSPERQFAKTTLVLSIPFTSLSSYNFTGLTANTYGFTLTLTGPGGSVTSDSTGVSGSIIPEITGSLLDASAPNPPTNVSVTSSTYGNDATITWTPSTTNCSAVTSYKIQYKRTVDSTWIDLVTKSFTVMSHNFSDGVWPSVPGVTLIANTSYDVRILANSDAGASSYSNITTFTTSNAPYSLITSGPGSMTTFSSAIISARLYNISGYPVSQSGVNITFSIPSTRGTFSNGSSTITAVTNSSGIASVTLNTNSTTGNLTISASGSGVPIGGSFLLPVNLSPARTPALSVLNQNFFGADISHSNYNSSWSYTSSTSGPGFIWPGQTAAATQFLIYIYAQNISAPSASQDANNVYCTSGSWNLAPSVSVTVNSSRDGYNNGSASISSSPLLGYASNYTYTWYYYDGSNYVVWPGPNSATRGKGDYYKTYIKGKTLFCRVEASRQWSGVLYGANSADSNKLTGS